MLHVLTALSALIVGTCGGVDWQSNQALGKIILKLAKQQQQVAAQLIDGDGSPGSQSADSQQAIISTCEATVLNEAFQSQAFISFGNLRGASPHAPARSGYPPAAFLV